MQENLVEVYEKDRGFLAWTNREHPYFSRAYLILKGLLTSQEIPGSDKFTLGYDDVFFLREKLAYFGLLNCAAISDGAFDFQQEIQKIKDFGESIKKGCNNARTRQLLQGKIKTELYEDQLSAVSFLLHHRRAGEFDDMGSGKTLISLATVAALGGEVDRVLVVCPLNVIFGFSREIQRRTNFTSLTIPNGTKNILGFLESKWEKKWKFLLVHPEALVAKGKEIYSPLTGFLKEKQFDMIIVDEFHQYKNVDAKRTQCVLSLLNEVKDRRGEPARVVCMTGTPVSESPLNAFTVLHVLSKDPIPAFSRFESYYCTKTLVPLRVYDKKLGRKVERKVLKVTSYKNLDDLKFRLSGVSIRRTKAEMTGFPDRISVVRDVMLTGKQLALYKAICGEMVKEIPPDRLVNLWAFLKTSNAAMRLRQCMNHPNLLDEEGESAKYLEIDSILEELFTDPDAKVVIWTAFRKSVDNIYDRYNDEYGAVKIVGGVDNLEKIALDFENSPRPRIAVCTAEKAGTGTDFLARARTAIYVDRPYSFVLYKQSMDRIHRRVASSGILSKLDLIRAQPATLYFLDGVGTVDELIRDKLFGKSDMVEAMTTSDEKLIEIGREDLIRFLKM